jgi:hypothetical protein
MRRDNVALGGNPSWRAAAANSNDWVAVNPVQGMTTEGQIQSNSPARIRRVMKLT